jgi:site-specific DNA-adenine methylase
MSKNQFFVPYYGNKYRETALSIEKGLAGIDWSKVKVVIEPFCGSAGFSRYIHYNIPDYKGDYVWADNDEGLIAFINAVKDGKFPDLFAQIKKDAATITDKEKFQTYRENLDATTASGWYSQKRIRGGFREMLFDADNVKRVCNLQGDRLKPLIELITSGRVSAVFQDSKKTAEDAMNLAKKHGKGSVVVFCDPPYFQSCNSYYSSAVKIESVQAEQGGNKYTDPDQSGMFCDILDLMRDPNVFAISVLNHSHLMAMFFKGFVVHIYDKTYGQAHKNKKTGENYVKQSKHMVISNMKA